MEEKIESGTFLAESCGRASDPPPPHPKVLPFFDAAPKCYNATLLGRPGTNHTAYMPHMCNGKPCTYIDRKLA